MHSNTNNNMPQKSENNRRMVSLIMPCKNGALTLSKSIESVLEQDFENLELLIIDDGSTDGSREIIEEHAKNDNRIKLLTNKGPGKGVWYARNIGLKNINGRYIAFLDCDDYLLPKSLSNRLRKLDESGAAVVHGAYLRLHPDGKAFYRPARTKVTYSNMLRKNHIGNLTGMYDSERLGVLLQESYGHEDYLMWCKLVKLSGISYSSGTEPLAVYRVSNTSLSGNKFKVFSWRWRVLRSGLNIKLIPACLYQILSQIYAISDRLLEKPVETE